MNGYRAIDDFPPELTIENPQAPAFPSKETQPNLGRAKPARKGTLSRILKRLLFLAFLVVFLLPAGILYLYRYIDPPVTPLMVLKALDGAGIKNEKTRLNEVSPVLLRTVIASEDGSFCTHGGFDWKEIENAVEEYQEEGKMRGASTISQQTAKNLFLWPGRNFVRKGLEAYYTVLLEAILPKSRILELYLNIAEWGTGVYGAKSASRVYFGKAPSMLSQHESALLAVVLPNPERFSASRPSNYIRNRAATIEKRAWQVLIPGMKGCP